MTGLPLIKKSFFLLVAAVLLVTSFGGQTVKADEPSDPRITTYVVPAITDEKILPTSPIPDDYISDEIFIRACPGEYEPASFVVRANEDITSLEAEATELIGESGSIASSNIDIRIVKCWYQTGVEIWDVSHKLLTPELLLKDDSLVKVEGEENYLKLSPGEYIWISGSEGIPGIHPESSPHNFPVKDSLMLQPVNIPAGTNKQFWVTVKVPDNSLPGIYEGTIELSTSEGLIGELQLKLEVLPIGLSQPYLTYSLYYLGRFEFVDERWGTISATYKTEEQFRAEMENIFKHGVTNPTVDQSSFVPFDETEKEYLRKILMIRNEVGMAGQPLFFIGLTPWGYQAIDKVKEVIALAKDYGITDVYFYGKDEATGETLIAQRESWQAIREAGGKIFVSGRKGVNSETMVDIQDLHVCAFEPSAEEAAKWHNAGHKIFSYANPQVGNEEPETYRRNYGLLLWQRDYDGAMNFAYQWNYHHIWNDFDDAEYRDHVFAYPTMDSVIDTIQWEGWREGITDVRYLTTLLELIEEAKAEGKDTSDAENWLADLKSADLMTKDLNAVRSQMIGYILYFLEKETSFNNEAAST